MSVIVHHVIWLVIDLESVCNGGGYAAELIGLNQGLTEEQEEGVGTMNTVRCNHCLRYMR
jgi:hypothetical protein